MAKVKTQPEPVRVVLSRPMSMGPEVTLPIGALLGEVKLAEGVTLGFFNHALYHGVAGEEPRQRENGIKPPVPPKGDAKLCDSGD